MKLNTLVLSVVAIAATTAGCTESPPANAGDSAEASSQPEQVTAAPSPPTVEVRAINHQGNRTGEPRVLQLEPEVGDPSEMGYTPVPAGSD
jgi:hypothetical protein